MKTADLRMLVGLLAFGIGGNGALAQTVRHVDGSVATSGNGSGWGTAALKTIQEAINMSNEEAQDEIWVRGGPSVPPYKPADATSSFVLKPRVRVYGGFNGTEDHTSFDPGKTNAISRPTRRF